MKFSCQILENYSKQTSIFVVPKICTLDCKLIELTDGEKNVLYKCLDFSVKLGLTEYREFLLPYELLFRDIKRENLCNEDMSLIKTRLLNTILTSYQNFSSD